MRARFFLLILGLLLGFGSAYVLPKVGSIFSVTISNEVEAQVPKKDSTIERVSEFDEELVSAYIDALAAVFVCVSLDVAETDLPKEVEDALERITEAFLILHAREKGVSEEFTTTAVNAASLARAFDHAVNARPPGSLDPRLIKILGWLVVTYTRQADDESRVPPIRKEGETLPI